MSATSVHATGSKVRGLRANALAGLVMLLIEYSLGISANLYSTLPAADSGKTLFAGLGAAVGNGPLLVNLHALLGTLKRRRTHRRSRLASDHDTGLATRG